MTINKETKGDLAVAREQHRQRTKVNWRGARITKKEAREESNPSTKQLSPDEKHFLAEQKQNRQWLEAQRRNHDHDISSAMYAQLMEISKCQYKAEQNADRLSMESRAVIGMLESERADALAEQGRLKIAENWWQVGTKEERLVSGIGDMTMGEQKKPKKSYKDEKRSRHRAFLDKKFAKVAEIDRSGAGEGEGVLAGLVEKPENMGVD